MYFHCGDNHPGSFCKVANNFKVNALNNNLWLCEPFVYCVLKTSVEGSCFIHRKYLDLWLCLLVAEFLSWPFSHLQTVQRDFQGKMLLNWRNPFWLFGLESSSLFTSWSAKKQVSRQWLETGAWRGLDGIWEVGRREKEKPSLVKDMTVPLQKLFFLLGKDPSPNSHQLFCW